MKPYFLVVLSMFSGCVFAQSTSINVAKFTSINSVVPVQQSGWIDLGETNNEKAWYAHTKSNPSNVGVALKLASKDLGNGYSTIETDTASVDCRGVSSSEYPSVMHVFVSEIDDAKTGYPLPGVTDDPAVANVPIQRGTIFAQAVKLSCDAVAKTNVNITLSLVSDGSRTPKLLGNTNLPDGSKLSIEFGGSGSDNPYSRKVISVVMHGQFEAGPFSDSGKPLRPDNYEVDIEMIVSNQPPLVADFIQRNSANFTGVAFPARTIGYSTYQVVIENLLPIKIL